MRRTNWLLGVLVCLGVLTGLASETSAQTYIKRQGYCQRPAQKVTTNGATSTTTVMQIVPGCTVTVYNTGTTVTASLYATATGTARINPIVADATGYYWYYAAAGRYDERFSGGVSPNTYPSPVTLTDVVISPTTFADPLVPVGGLGAVQIDNGGGQLDGDQGIRVDLNDMLLRIGRSGFTGKLSLYNTNGYGTTIQAGSQSQNWTITLPTGTPAVGQALFATAVGGGSVTTAWQTPSALRVANLGTLLTQRSTLNIGGVQVDGDSASSGLAATDNSLTGQTDLTTKGVPTKVRNLITDYNASPDASLITGSITVGTNSLTVSGSARWKVGHGILVAGAGVSGADLITTVTAINGLVFTLATNASTTVTGVRVQHDNSAAFQAAIDGKLNPYVPQGDYLIARPLVLPTDITEGFPLRLTGAGPGATKLLNQTTGDLFVGQANSTIQNLIIEDLSISNTTPGNPYTTSLSNSNGYAINLIDVGTANQVKVRNVVINGFRGAFACANCQNGLIENFTIREFKTCAVCLVSPETVFVGAAESNVTALKDGLVELGLYAADADVPLTGISWTSGSKTLTVGSSTFNANHVGRWVRITNAGQTGGDVIAMIRTVNSATSVTLSAANNSGSTISGGSGTMFKTNIATLWLHRASQGDHQNLTLQGNWSNAITGHDTSAVRLENSSGVVFKNLWVEESGGQGGPDLLVKDSNNVGFVGYHSNADPGLWPGSHSAFAKLVNSKGIAVKSADLVSSVSPFDVDVDSTLSVDDSYLGYPAGRFVTGYQNITYGENVVFRLNGAETVGNASLMDSVYGEQFILNPRYDDAAGANTNWTEAIPTALTYTSSGTGRQQRYVTVNRQGASATTTTSLVISQAVTVPDDVPAGWWTVGFDWRVNDFGSPRVSCGSSGGGEVFVDVAASSTGGIGYPAGSALGLRWSNSQCDGTPEDKWFRSNLRVYLGTGTGRTFTVRVYSAAGAQTPAVDFTNWRLMPGKHAVASYDQPITQYKGGLIETAASLIFKDGIGGGTRTVCINNAGAVVFGICGGGGGGGGTGDVVGPSSATDNAVVRFDTTTGKLVQNSTVTVGDTGNVAGVGTLNTHTIPGGTDTFGMLNATQTFNNKTLVTPTIASFANATHNHTNAAGGGQLALNAFSSVTGSGAVVGANSPTLITPNLGTPSAAVLTFATGLPVDTGITGLGSGVSAFLQTPSSANLATAVTNETGTSALVFNTQPTLDKPVFTSYTYATLPTPATNMQVVVTDCANTACSSGGGSTVRLLRYNGSAWAVLGDGDSGGTPAFSSITAGTNTAALVVGTGGSLGVSGTGTIAATSVTGLSVTASKTLTVSNSLTLSGTDSSSIAFGGGGTVAYTDKANTFGAFAQNFAAATSLTIPTSAGAAPTASGTIAYDSTSNTWEAGVNGGNKTFLFTDGNGSSLTALNGSAVASGTVGLTVGGTGVTSWASNQVLVGTGTNTAALKTIPSCSNATTSKLLYDNGTQTFTCGTDQTGSGGSSADGTTIVDTGVLSVNTANAFVWTNTHGFRTNIGTGSTTNTNPVNLVTLSPNTAPGNGNYKASPALVLRAQADAGAGAFNTGYRFYVLPSDTTGQTTLDIQFNNGISGSTSWTSVLQLGPTGNLLVQNNLQQTGYADIARNGAFSAPASGYLRVYANNTTGKLTCVDSSGADCFATPSEPLLNLPIPLSGLLAWWDVAKISAAEGDAVSTVTDLSGNGYDLTSSSTNRPTYTRTAAGPFPALYFDGVNDGMTNGSLITDRRALTTFTVIRPLRSGLQNTFLALGSNQFRLQHYQTVAQLYNGSSYLFGALTGSQVPIYDDWQIVTTTNDASNSIVYKGPYTQSDTALSAGGQTAIALGRDDASSTFFKGHIAEVIVYNRVLTATERMQVEARLRAKYGIEVKPDSQSDLVAFIGNSLLTSFNLNADTDSVPAQVNRALGYGYKAKNFGIGNFSTAQLTSVTAHANYINSYYDAKRRKNIAVVWEVTNDLVNNGVTATTAYNNYVNYCTALRNAGWKVVAVTVLHRSNNSTLNTNIDTVNTNIRANWSTFADALADPAAVANLSNETNTTYFQVDQVHLNATGNTEAMNVIYPQVLKLLAPGFYLPIKHWLPAAGCNNTTAGSMWDLPTSAAAAAACVTGTNIQKGVLDFADTSGGFSAQTTLALPSDWTASTLPDVNIYWTTSATSGQVKWTMTFVCTDAAASATDDPAFPTSSNGFNTVTTAVPGTANRVQTSTITGATLPTSCVTGTRNLLHVKIFRDGADAADTASATVRLIGAELTIRRGY